MKECLTRKKCNNNCNLLWKYKSLTPFSSYSKLIASHVIRIWCLKYKYSWITLKPAPRAWNKWSSFFFFARNFLSICFRHRPWKENVPLKDVDNNKASSGIVTSLTLIEVSVIHHVIEYEFVRIPHKSFKCLYHTRTTEGCFELTVEVI